MSQSDLEPIRTQDALLEWIADQPREWRWFVTLTFAGRGQQNADRAMRAFRSWARQVASAALPTARAKRTAHVPWIAAVEPHRFRDSVHVHAVLAGVENLDPDEFAGLWGRGFARIKPFRPSHLAYTLKRVDRGALADFSREAIGAAR